MARNMFQVIITFLMTFALRLICVAKAQTCTVGDHADSTRFGDDFVYGLFASGQYSTYIGDYGCFIQTNRSSGTSFTIARPAQVASADFSVFGMPEHFKLTYTAESTVDRTTGLQDGTLHISLDNNLRLYLYGSNSQEFTYGATGVIPLEFQGQEYFASIRAGPGLGQVVISSTGETTFVRLTPNGPFMYDGVTYTSPLSDLEVEIPAWYQMVITTSSNDFTGSRILANKSISVVSGSACAYSPELFAGSCDYAIEQLIPYDKWGTSFYVPPFADGSTGYYIQVTAGRDNTNINVDGASVSLSQGQTESREVTTNTMLRITSDKPIQVVQFLKGATSMVVIPPEEQYTLKTTYIRITGADSLGFTLTHYFTIVVPCASGSGIDITYTAPGNAIYTPTVQSPTSNGAMCAYPYQGTQTATYTITQSNTNGAFFVVNYGRDNSAGYAYVGGQKYETQRCPDYQTIIYGADETTTSQPTTTQPTTTIQPLPAPTISPTTQMTTTPTSADSLTETTTSEPSTAKVMTTWATTNSVGPARKISSNFSLRFTDKTVATSKRIETVEGPTTQIRCAQQCMSTVNCDAFTWVAAGRYCVLSGSLEDPADLVQEVGVHVFVRS